MTLEISQSENFFDVLECQRRGDEKMLHVAYCEERYIVHLRKLKVNFENSPSELWLLSDQDVMNIFKGKYMAYHCNFFKDLEQFYEIGKIKLPLIRISLSEIESCEAEDRSFGDYISSLCKEKLLG